LDALDVRAMRFDEVNERIAAELVPGAAGEFPRDRRLCDDRERLDRLDVRALDERLRGLAGAEVDRVERLRRPALRS